MICSRRIKDTTTKSGVEMAGQYKQIYLKSDVGYTTILISGPALSRT